MEAPEMVITPWASSLCTSISSQTATPSFCLPLHATAQGFYFLAEPILVTQQGIPLVLFTNRELPLTHNFLFLLHQVEVRTAAFTF